MKIVYQGKTKKGKDIIIRYPQLGDEAEMLKFINQISDERTFVRYQGEHETLESEVKYLGSVLDAIKNHKEVRLLVFSNDQLIASTDIHLLDKTEKHIGIFGIILNKDFRGEGLGTLLMELILKEAEKEIPDLKIVTLEVYSTNLIAQGLYKKMGFVQYGLLPKGIYRAGTFEDAILMYKNIK
jgi:RimJ/RimL family protein N-acetyltransferase